MNALPAQNGCTRVGAAFAQYPECRASAWIRRSSLLRIIEALTDGVVTIQLHGGLVADWVDELRSTIAKNGTATGLRVDLTELRYADAAGIELLRSLRRAGIDITSNSLYSGALVEETDAL